MWMMGYNDGGDFNMPDSFNGRKLRPLMPRVPHAPTPTTYLRGIHGDNFIALNHHQLAMSEQNKRDFNTQQLVVSSRWNPTPEQLQTLEELYRRGTRTPSAEQIQHITAQLRRYGKIEGKNVFYWFQNHKARERQKRRRQLESAANNGAAVGDDYSNTNSNAENAERKESGANRTVFEIEQTKHWPSPTNCSTLAEKTAATTKTGGGGVAESCRAAAAERWIPFDESEQRRSLLAERNATWQMMHLSCSAPTNTNTNTIHLMTNINSSNAPTICSNAITATTTPITSTCPSTPRTMDHHQRPKQPLKSKDHLNIFIAPFRSTCDQKHENIIGDDDEGGHGESQTLELFPLRSSNDDNNDENNFSDKDEIGGAAANSNNNFSSTTHYQFFEFLPLKNGRN